MCGRYASFREAQDLADAFAVSPDGIAEDARLLPPSWNVAPTDPVRVVVEREPHVPSEERAAGGGATEAAGSPERSLRLARWGLVPGWAKDPSVGSRMINARVESLAEKPAFRRALVSRRCVVPAEGYFEWKKPDGSAPPRTPKQPFWIHAEDGSPLAFAGLYEFWRDPARADDDPLRWLVSMTIVTAARPPTTLCWAASTTGHPWCWTGPSGTPGSTLATPTRRRPWSCSASPRAGSSPHP